MTNQRTEAPGPKPQETQEPSATPPTSISQPSLNSNDESPRPALVIAPSGRGWKITSNGIMVVFTAVIAFAAVVQCVNTYLQWDTMKKQLELSQRPWIEQEFERSITFTWNQDR